MFEYVGAIHIHSLFSDGTGAPDEIAGFANEVGLDFIILTDHNTLRALDDGFENYYGNTLLLVGCEINDRENKNHYLAMNINQTISTRLEVCEYVAEVRKKGGIGFIAHPFEKRSTFEKHPPYPWTEWQCEDFTGIEIWNHMSEWVETLNNENKINHLIHPLRTIEKPNADAINKWDELNLKRKVVGIGGIDAHAHKMNLLGFVDFEIFPYKVLFKSIRTHILSDKKITVNKEHVAANKRIILEALEKGNCFVANDYVKDSSGFRFFAENSNGIFTMGDSIDESQAARLKVLLPGVEAEIKLIRNGKQISKLKNKEAEFRNLKKGIYRVEIYLKNKAWIFSNHIRIGM